jgi:hypothetical protein
MGDMVCSVAAMELDASRRRRYGQLDSAALGSIFAEYCAGGAGVGDMAMVAACDAVGGFFSERRYAWR